MTNDANATAAVTTDSTAATTAAATNTATATAAGATGASADTSAATGGAEGTTTSATTEGAKGGEEKAGGEGKKEGEVATGAPEKYEIKFAEGAQIDAEMLQEFETIAREKGLNQESAQALALLGPKLAEKFAAKQAASINEVMTSASAEWAKQSLADKEFGGEKLEANLAFAAKTRDAFGTPELAKLFGKYDPVENPQGTGLANHPEVIRFFYKVGKGMSEDTVVTSGGSQGTAVDTASILFPTMKK